MLTHAPRGAAVLSFFQVLSTLDSVYGARLPSAFYDWMPILNLDLFEFGYPSSCLGTMGNRLFAAATWPLAAMGCVFAFFVSQAATVGICGRSHALGAGPRGRFWTPVLFRTLHVCLLISYTLLPSVSRSIFTARQCESFVYDSRADRDELRSFLRADMDVRCSEEDDTYRSLQVMFWIFFFLWPVLVPMVYAELLRRALPDIRAGRSSLRLAQATRFLWKDYLPGFLFWEVADTARKLLLTSAILFVDTEAGSRKLLRLCLAILVTTLYLSALCLARPYAMVTDLYLACMSNAMLICCFVSGVVIKVCEEHDCFGIVGLFGDAATAISVIAGVSVLMIVLVCVTIIRQGLSSGVMQQTIRLRSTGREPELSLSPSCAFHGFISHARVPPSRVPLFWSMMALLAPRVLAK